MSGAPLFSRERALRSEGEGPCLVNNSVGPSQGLSFCPFVVMGLQSRCPHRARSAHSHAHGAPEAHGLSTLRAVGAESSPGSSWPSFPHMF